MGRRAVHLVTNTRALPADRVQPLVEGAARASLEGVPTARIVLRGDSTLRGHLLEEYLGVRSVIAPAGWPVLLLVPALPSAGRVTVGGVHLFEREGVRTPLHETEYARDGVFAYDSARLLDWAEERSAGLFGWRRRELSLDGVRAGGGGRRGGNACARLPRRSGRVRARRGDGRRPGGDRSRLPAAAAAGAS